MRPCRHYYARFDRAARRLTLEALRGAADPVALAAVEVRLRGARHPTGHALHDLNRIWSRAELGQLIVEATNRGRQLAAGERRRIPGPALDPARIPDDRLVWLIQRHADMAVVEACRAERERRAEDRRAAA